MIAACILGGGGFIGTSLVRELIAKGHAVTIFGRPPRFPESLEGVTVKCGAFHDHAKLIDAVSGQDVVFHLIGANTPATGDYDRAADLRQNVEASLALLEAGRYGAFGRIVFVSSGGTVYGAQTVIPIPEDAPQWPISAYGVSKVTLEKYLHLYNHLHALDYRIARVSNPFGEYQLATKGQGLIAAALIKGLTGEAIPMSGNGEIVRDYIHVSDVVIALSTLAVYKGPQRIFNIGSGEGKSVCEVLKAIQDVLGLTLKIDKLPGRAFDVPVNVLDIGRAARELKWAPNVDFGTGLVRTAHWMRAYLNREPPQPTFGRGG